MRKLSFSVSKTIKFFRREEIFVLTIIFLAVLTAIYPLIYELKAIAANQLPEIRYPIIESDFAPDMRVHLSRMRQGYEGKWLVKEKYTAEPHQPSIFHISYLLMGKVTGFFGLQPEQAWPIWRIIGGVFWLGAGYFFLLHCFAEKRLRLSAFALFVLVGNIPILVKSGGIPLGEWQFSTYLPWFTFYDPAKRIIFLPHYTFSAAFLTLTMAFLGEGIGSWRRKRFWQAGIFAFLAGIVMPHSLVIAATTGVFLILIDILSKISQGHFRERLGKAISLSWPFWVLIALCLVLYKLSFSYFPWNVQSLADLTKRNFQFEYPNVLRALGLTGPLALLALVLVFWRKLKTGYLSACWFLAVVVWVKVFEIFPISNPQRFTQIDVHLPLAVLTVILFDFLTQLVKKRKRAVFNFLMGFILLPSLLNWAISMRAQTLIIEAKIKADVPLVPQLPYLVYPIKPVMEAVFWLRDNTDHEQVVLTAETLGSMIPAYAGNTVVVGHGNQTVYFEQKMAAVKRFYQNQMNALGQAEFLSTNRVKYIFWGPEEREISGLNQAPNWPWPTVYNNQGVVIYQVSN
jgi:hypothetical protein